MIQTLSRTKSFEAKIVSPEQVEIDALVQKEKKVRDAIAALPKKGAIQERRQLERDIEHIAKQRQFWESLSKFNLGTKVVAAHRKNKEGVVVGFQEYAGRKVSVWVCWERSQVAMPEYPTLLQTK